MALLAVKPQMMGAALPALVALGNGTTLFVSIAAGTTIGAFEATLGAQTPIVRTMPNTPAMVNTSPARTTFVIELDQPSVTSVWVFAPVAAV